MKYGDKVDIVCLSTQDWTDLWTRKQRFMQRFAREGHRVLYVETQFHWVSYFLRFRTQWRRIRSFFAGPRQLEPNLWVYTPPIVLPFFQMWRPVGYLNSLLLRSYLKRQLGVLGFSNELIYCYAPYATTLVSMLGAKRVVYECVDEFAAAKGLIRGDVVRDLELEMIRQSDVTIVTAQSLYDTKQMVAGRIHLIPNAADVAHFNRAVSANATVDDPLMTEIPRPRIGFLGAVAYWVDLKLISFLAENRPEYQFVFVGPTHVDVKTLRRFNNIHWLGRQSYERLPELMAGIDVCLNPYVCDGVATACSPLKLYEYLATGKPIVSVRMPEAERFSYLTFIGDGYDGMLEQIDRALQLTPTQLAELSTKQIAESRNHTWDERFAATKRALGGLLDNSIVATSESSRRNAQ